jgi:hypothetical protein
MRKRPGLKLQDIRKQVAVNAKDRVRIVKMPSEKAASQMPPAESSTGKGP